VVNASGRAEKQVWADGGERVVAVVVVVAVHYYEEYHHARLYNAIIQTSMSITNKMCVKTKPRLTRD